jgi:hypothetical protein
MPTGNRQPFYAVRTALWDKRCGGQILRLRVFDAGNPVAGRLIPTRTSDKLRAGEAGIYRIKSSEIGFFGGV